MKLAPRAASQAAATLVVLVATRSSPSFSALGPRGALPAWLAYAVVVTLCIPFIVGRLAGRLTTRQRSPIATGSAPRPMREWALSWGRTRRDAAWLGLGIAAAIALAWGLSRWPDVRSYYPRYAVVRTEPLLWLPSTLLFGLYNFAWEAMFRGHLLLALAPEDDRRRAAMLLALQTALFAIGHLDKPPLEAWLSVPAGVVLGLLALRTRSILPGFALHFTAATAVNLFCAYA